MSLTEFRQQLRQGVAFADTLAFIEQHYVYQPRAFQNGSVHNAAGENVGSCKILGWALLEHLSTEEALLAFGEHWHGVQADPEGTGHANIRALQRTGLAAVHFEQLPLTRR